MLFSGNVLLPPRTTTPWSAGIITSRYTESGPASVLRHAELLQMGE